LLRDSGARVCLFTDQANPTSNKIYAAIGYEPVAEMANLVISSAVTTPARA
jgi:predicted GNAT family acetyltransferase